MMNDPIADLLTRVRNGYMARLQVVEVPYSMMRESILRILKKNNYIVEYTLDSATRIFTVTLQDIRKTKYIPSFRRISKP